MNYELIFLAAGQGKRMNAKRNKMWLELFDEPIFIHALKPFLMDSRCTHIVIVCQAEEVSLVFESLQNLDLAGTKVEVVTGGSERQYSVRNGLVKCEEEEIILVHDGARPFVTLDIVDRLLDAVLQQDASICAVKVKDTVKRVSLGFVRETVDRDNLWQIQTPQAFRAGLLKEAHQRAFAEDFLGTDEASLVERLSAKICVVEGSYYNIKLTTPEDMPLAKAIFGELGGNVR
ncbi:2-C-methyl-D-erythritol 4-phosphate cytidylyltransferase [Listeria fleischmannii subsp. fleischmannii]|uniref:2-C-methyl-D-erythritol 4-phosphate cytidylyltransferase n=1 Tax=Listeria fleischmannii subsp. fleischmannii TaxID=1671902 RepID=A0A2X3GR36_9LIST|nr:2-C-methyl-D-erythritol 4-phosphate cytidylyltransferase [Listeria fleischmannii]SQC70888.1 2-C-methyl-D-erythritol 4-phosphate cytidylyltransferase [Listeria fleischmannii subsp. fleischmannii]